MRLEDIDPLHMIDFDEWQRIVNLLCNIAHVTSAAITHLDLPYIEVFKVSQNKDNPIYEGMKVELAEHYCEQVVKERRKVLVANATKSERWASAPELEHSLISYLGYPILLPDGRIFGTICLHDSKENPYSQEIDELLQHFRRLVESHFALTKQAKDLQDKVNEIELLKGIIPICSHCKSIRNDDGYWMEVEAFIKKHPAAAFSHGLCPTCAKKFYPDFFSSD